MRAPFTGEEGQCRCASHSGNPWRGLSPGLAGGLGPRSRGWACVSVRARGGERVSGACEPGVCARSPRSECGRRDTAARRPPAGVPPSQLLRRLAGPPATRPSAPAASTQSFPGADAQAQRLEPGRRGGGRPSARLRCQHRLSVEPAGALVFCPLGGSRGRGAVARIREEPRLLTADPAWLPSAFVGSRRKKKKKKERKTGTAAKLPEQGTGEVSTAAKVVPVSVATGLKVWRRLGCRGGKTDAPSLAPLNGQADRAKAGGRLKEAPGLLRASSSLALDFKDAKGRGMDSVSRKSTEDGFKM